MQLCTDRADKKIFRSTGSLPTWLQWPELSQSAARRLFLVSHIVAWFQRFGPSSLQAINRELDAKWNS